MLKVIDKKRQLKRKRYIRKLVKYYISKAGQLSKLVKLKIIDRAELSYGYSSLTEQKDKYLITLDLINRDRKIREGYFNDYYENRAEVLNFVRGNKKLALHFVILHELGHAVLRDRGKNTELNADNYATDRLRQEGFLKDNIQENKKHIED
jgi:Zn-dependent peptidase ImmA (M78 family)